jgi:hypothetical protein
VAAAGASRRWLTATVAVALLLLAGRLVASLYVDFLWYDAMGAAALWKARAGNAILLRGGAAALGAAFVFANLYAVRGSVASFVLPRRVANLEIGEEVSGRYLVGTIAGISILIGALLTLALPDWTAIGLPRYGVPFNETETPSSSISASTRTGCRWSARCTPGRSSSCSRSPPSSWGCMPSRPACGGSAACCACPPTCGVT